MKKLIKPTIIWAIMIFIVYLCACFANVRQSVRLALDTGINILMPSLFPFFVISDIAVKLISDNSGVAVRIFSKLFRLPGEASGAFICGTISGYPVGASAVYTLYRDKVLTKNQAERMLCFANNSGPLFVICAIGCGMLGSLRAGIILYVVHIGSAVITGVLSGMLSKSIDTTCQNRKNSNTKAINPAESIEKGFMQCIRVIGFVVFFSVITDMLLYFCAKAGIDTESKLAAIFICIIEITNGVVRVCTSFDTETAMCIISFACGFSGIGVIMQTALVTDSKLSLKKYAAYKLLMGIISACLCKGILIFGKISFDKSFAPGGEMIKIASVAVCYLMFFLYVIKRYGKRNR